MVSTRTTLSAVVVLGFAGISGTAFAQLPGIYAGASAGQSGVEESTFGNFKENDTGIKAFIGAEWGMFGLEGGYVDLGKPNTAGTEVKITGWDVFGIVRLPLVIVDVFAKAGFIQWDSKVTSGGTVSDSGTDPAFGVGVRFPMGRNFGLRAEYERYNIKDLDRVDLISAGAEWRF